MSASTNPETILECSQIKMCSYWDHFTALLFWESSKVYHLVCYSFLLVCFLFQLLNSSFLIGSFLFSSFLLKYSLITSLIFPNSVNILIPNALNYLSGKLFISVYFILFYFIFFFLSLFFFLPFILSCVEDRLLVLQPGVRAVPLRWESHVQDTGPQETSQLHVIPNGENLPEISISTPGPSFTQRPASYSAGHPMPNN